MELNDVMGLATRSWKTFQRLPWPSRFTRMAERTRMTPQAGGWRRTLPSRTLLRRLSGR